MVLHTVRWNNENGGHGAALLIVVVGTSRHRHQRTFFFITKEKESDLCVSHFYYWISAVLSLNVGIISRNLKQ